MKKMMGVHGLAILLPIGVAALLFAFRSSAQEVDDRSDMLAYVSEDNDLMLYNPRDRSEVRLLENVGDFALGRNGRIAFTKADEQDSDLYVFDPSTPAVAAVNISEGLGEHNEPLGWSPDERYFAFETYDERDDRFLYVWNGETSINVMPENALDTVYWIYIKWSYDGRLAFTLAHDFFDDVPSEMYLWDGSTTTNLNPNPDGYDGIAGWSEAGQLLISSNRSGDIGTYVWDGVSFKDGAADPDSFIRVGRELDPQTPIWMDEGLIGFTTIFPKEEVVLWDLETYLAVERFPISSEDTFSRLAEGGEVVMSLRAESRLPTYYLEVSNIEGDILFSVHIGNYAWSADGYLAYCGIGENREWLLSVWDGEKSWVITSLENMTVRWQQGGDSVNCNYG